MDKYSYEFEYTNYPDHTNMNACWYKLGYLHPEGSEKIGHATIVTIGSFNFNLIDHISFTCQNSKDGKDQ